MTSPRTMPAWKWLVFVAYLGLVGVTIAHHEPWFDEAQSWLLARDPGYAELYTHYLRYEGHPGLWHTILSVPAKLGLPYYPTINIISAALSALGVFLFLRFAPFPCYVLVLLPFTYWACYQYAVVARSYSLAPPLLFAVAVLYRDKTKRIIPFTLLLCLLANVSLHGFLIAAAIMFFHLLDVLREWKDLDSATRRRNVLAFALAFLTAVLLVGQLWPPADSNFAPGFKTDPVDIAGRAVHLLVHSLTGHVLTAVPVLAGTWLWLGHRHRLGLYVLATGAVLALGSIKYTNVWHEGTLFYLWLFCLWLSFDEPTPSEAETKPDPLALAGAAGCGLRAFVTFGLVLTLAIQVYWAAGTIRLDLEGPYSGCPEAVHYLKQNQRPGETIFVAGARGVALLPYFEKNIYANHNRGPRDQGVTHWIWSTENTTIWYIEAATAEQFDAIRRARPDWIVLSVWMKEHVRMPDWPEYRVAATFEGHLYWKGERFEDETFIILRRLRTGEGDP